MDTDIATIAAIVVAATFGVLFAGPFGAIVVGLIFVLVGVTTGKSKNDDGSTPINCPECGSLVSPQASECAHCGATVDEAA